MDDARLELVRDWLTRASHDLATARALSALDEPLLDCPASAGPYRTIQLCRENPS